MSGDAPSASQPSRPGQTAVDYVTIVLSPVLVMGLVGSLVFFLLEVFYKTDGEWKDRLQWILFFYVFGIVLTARISMDAGSSAMAPVYGGVLAVLTYLGMQGFVEYPAGIKELSLLINILLVGVVWWCAHRLVWDCTNIDEEADMSGEGLLQAAGLDQEAPPQPSESDESEPETTRSGRPLSWLDRYERYRRKKEKKRILGVWVVYFSLAALPLFGLGQSLIPLTAPNRRQFAFWLMTVYIGCGLGLLLTTCFLGLRRYLRQKRLQMPAAMTGMWLSVGGVLIVLLLLTGALLPRPYAEYSLLDLAKGSATKRKANRLAFKGDAPAEGPGQPGAGKPDGKGPGEQPGENGQKGGEKDARGGQGKDGKDKSSGGDGKEKGEQAGGNEKGEKGKDGKSEQGDKQDGGQKGEKGQPSGRGADPARTAKGMKDMHNQEKGASGRSSSSRSNAVQQFLQRLSPILKWIVFGVLALLVVLALLRGGLGFLSNFTDWAKRLLDAWRNWWANLFGAKKPDGSPAEESQAEEAVEERHRPFSSFSNPFETGQATRKPVRELVRYTFAALEAWARDRHFPRRNDETAAEFAGRLAEEVPALETAVKQLAGLHARAEYARDNLPGSAAETLRAFWERLERVTEAPLSA